MYVSPSYVDLILPIRTFERVLLTANYCSADCTAPKRDGYENYLNTNEQSVTLLTSALFTLREPTHHGFFGSAALDLKAFSMHGV